MTPRSATESIARSTRRPRPFEYSVRWRRERWAEPQARLFRSAWFAAWFADRLSTAFPTRRGPVVEITVERRTVGPWLAFEVDR